MPSVVTIEVYKRAGSIFNSGLGFNLENKMEKRGQGLSERHAASAKAPNDELGVFACDFCREYDIEIHDA